MGWFKKVLSYLTEKISITITPSPQYKIKNIRIHRFVPTFILIIIVISLVTLTGLYKYYENNYLLLSRQLTEFKDVRTENKKLKNELFVLNQDTKILKENLAKLKEYNQEIKSMIDPTQNNIAENEEKIDFKLHTLFAFNENVIRQGLPIGGGEIHLYYQEVDELIRKTKKNIDILKEEIPTQKEDLTNLEISVKKHNDLLRATPNTWPLADKGNSYISSNFGWRVDPITGKREFHDGLDIAAWYNTPILATADGCVKYSGWINGYGRIVKIDHGFGFETRYAHLNKLKVKKGDIVKRGQIIGLSGNSGRSTGPHLHYEVRKNNIPQSPREYIGR